MILWLRDHRRDPNLNIYFASYIEMRGFIEMLYIYTLRNFHMKLRGNDTTPRTTTSLIRRTCAKPADITYITMLRLGNRNRDWYNCNIY